MSASRIHRAMRRAHAMLARAQSRVTGVPTIDNRGTLDIGGDFTFSSYPSTSHIMVARGGRMTVGDRVSIGSGAAIACSDEIRIGNDVHIGRDVMILDTDFHEARSMESHGRSEPIIVRDRVRIDDGVVILKGARIEAGAQIGPDSVVSGVIPRGVRARGVPARGTREDALVAFGDVASRVRAVVEALAPIEWDSLGTLRLLVALEEELGVVLPESALACSAIHGVDAVIDAVERAL
jgi:acetyltransferase-like isoleucine patch superfamily enzyme